MNRYIQQGMTLANSNARGFEYGRNEAQRNSAAGQMQGLVNRDAEGNLTYDPASPALSNPHVVDRVKMAMDLDVATQRARQSRMLDLIRQMQIEDTMRKVKDERDRRSAQEVLFSRPAVPTGRIFTPEGQQMEGPVPQPRQSQSSFIPSAPGGPPALDLPEAGDGPESLIPPGLDRNTAALMTPNDMSRVIRSQIAPSTTTSGGRSPVERKTFMTPDGGKIVTFLSNGTQLINGQPGNVIVDLTPEERLSMRAPGQQKGLSTTAAKMLLEQEAIVEKTEAELAKAQSQTPSMFGPSESSIQRSVEQSRLARDMAMRQAEKARGYLLPQSQRGGATPTPTPRPTVTPAPVASPAASPAPISAGGFPTPTPTAQGVPRAGDVMKGYRFKGGDPAQRSNWEKVQ